MAKHGRSGAMQVVLNGRLVGVLSLAGSGAISFAYDPGWLSWEHAMPISLSLPLREEAHRGGPVIAYLENLLPDNLRIRERVAARVRAGGTDAWHMLEKIGRDCVGALQFVSGDVPEIGQLAGETVSEAQIADMLRNLASAPLGLNEDDDFRISIAGAQEKTALLRHENAWIRPSGLTPTTHILKTQLGVLPAGIDLSDSVENEYFCMRFCRAMGVDVAEVEIADFEDVRSLVVTRFDRRWTRDGRLIRLPQEDFCQALTVPPSRKYQMDGGPGIAEGIALLAGSDDPAANQRTFFRAQALFWLLGATDGHAKNFSIALRPGGFRMTPLYDVLSAQKAVDDGQIRQNRMRLAMAVDGHYRINEVVPRHFLQSARAAGYGVALAEEVLSGILPELEPALERTLADLPDGFPQPLAEAICAGVRRRAGAFRAL
ncbi:type II toxin-antitoxin system HipA family toxin [Paracoccus sp. 1_MG-2023]|uniref:type II toxin-antitoxin system HipA family toxin n=1 Tax=unclassified Paracoccus (in: a-proteobacteria) TaxID=2688777 RepID=UPI001C09AB0D|nr:MULTISPECIES: type II toxin-antitoxin system HipA family toxin [unclassified Paracoccus (in: a-proteobacteria)]MBU2958025.1 type II toxin-antitoxin system HipA family toxin [Paracoccus sp. C2R09]MDO6670297.1 type II toxin-antitoxin system HipA family toxin [Paracoccus sp. 1_MG-2023]